MTCRARLRKEPDVNIVLSVLMLAALALVAGAFVLWRRGVRKQAALMVLLAVIAVLNIAIWTIPTESGEAPLDRIPTEQGD